MAPNISELGRFLKESGYKLTVQRYVILELIVKNKDKHLSAEEIFELVKESYPSIGLATIYRTLSLFEKVKLVQQIYLDDGCVRYQLSDPEEKHEHHHLICEACGAVIDIQEDLLDDLEKQVKWKNGFMVTNHRVKLFGLCENCSKLYQVITQAK